MNTKLRKSLILGTVCAAFAVGLSAYRAYEEDARRYDLIYRASTEALFNLPTEAVVTMPQQPRHWRIVEIGTTHGQRIYGNMEENGSWMISACHFETLDPEGCIEIDNGRSDAVSRRTYVDIRRRIDLALATVATPENRIQ